LKKVRVLIEKPVKRTRIIGLLLESYPRADDGTAWGTGELGLKAMRTRTSALPASKGLSYKDERAGTN